MTPKSQDYVVDNKTHTLVAHQQRFVYGKEPGEVLEERWYESVFGLVLPPVFDSLKDPGEQFALLWGGFDDGAVNSAPISGFWDLAKAKSIEEATRAIDRFSFAGISVLLAFGDGTIGYRLAALTPNERKASERYLPRDGSKQRAQWPDYLPMLLRPQEQNPAKGYIIASNQRIVSDEDPRLNAVGGGSGSWSRALRIRERIDTLLRQSSPIAAQALLDIQEDSIAPEAQALAPLFAAHCPRRMPGIDDKLSAQFCDALSHFDGNFTKNSQGALPYVFMLEAVREAILRRTVGAPAAQQVGARLFSHLLITGALVAEKNNPSVDVINCISEAAPVALQKVIKEIGTSPSSWAWGQHHELTSKGALYPAPLIGTLFSTTSRPQAGYAHAPLAESGLPVKAGPVMRMVVDMKDPFARITLDTGNGGIPGHPHFEDMAPHWDRGDPMQVPVDKGQIAHDAEEHFWLLGIKKSV
jgi:penicillin amidase